MLLRAIIPHPLPLCKCPVLISSNHNYVIYNDYAGSDACCGGGNWEGIEQGQQGARCKYALCLRVNE